MKIFLKKLLSPNVDNSRIDNLEENIENNAYNNISDLNATELQDFKEAVEVEVEVALADLPTKEDEEAYRKGLMDLFNPNSEVYNDIEAATEQVIEEIDENHSNIFDNIDGEEVLAAYRIRISTKLVASGINLCVSLLCGGV